MKEIYNKMGEFSVKVFNKNNSIDHIRKLKDEADELINDPLDITEYADCFLCLFASAYKAGFTHDEILKACDDKYHILLNRKWEILPNGMYQHIK
ncbi:DUF550 domain-containing protein [bacterium]|jgi:hypothetical protein|nr:DUF550 domain-containing protein [bacterium]